MLLRDDEITFLTSFVREATTDPFNGPATNELHRRNIYYTDLPDLMAAYYAWNLGDPRLEADDSGRERLVCPWRDRAAAIGRNEEIRAELHKTAKPMV